jgi:asparagine synthase (glutamine-hydrolysing)
VNRLDTAFSLLRERGERVKRADIPNGVMAAFHPPPETDCPVPGADLAESNGLVAVCHGSLYDAAQMYMAMGQETPPEIERNPARAILDSYLKWGQGAMRSWRGEASFAVWDPAQRLLIAGRDHMGTRPLFFCRRGSLVAIGTDTKALLAIADRSLEPDPVTMRRFLCQGFFHDERTFFVHVNRILPGTMVLVREGRLTMTKYWRLEDVEPVRYKDPSEYGEHFVGVLSKAIERRDVDSPRFGSGLSGGLDSSSLVCLCSELRAKAGGRPLPISALVETDSDYDGSRYVNAVVEKYGTSGGATSTEYWDIFEEWEKVASVHDEPATAMSVTNFWIQKALSRSLGLRIQMSGVGADEVLAGELQYFSDLLRGGRWGEMISEINDYARINSMGHSRGRFELFLRYALAPVVPRPLRTLRRRLMSADNFPWLGAALAKLPREREPQPAPGFGDEFHREMAATMLSRYTPLLLHYEDRNAAMGGIEQRYPYLDVDVVRFCYGLPREELMSKGHAKIVLKRGMKGILPDAVWNRQAKSGIPSLIVRWLTRDYEPRVSMYLRSSRLVADGWLNGRELRRLYDRLSGGEHGLRLRFWRALALEGWYRSYWP